MKLSENRHIARTVLAAVVIAGTLLSGRAGLSGIRTSATDAFYGQDGIASDLSRRCDSALLLCELAKDYNIEASAISRVQEAAAQASESDAPISQRGKAHTELSLAVDSLYTRMEQADLPQADADYAYSLLKDTQSRSQIIDRSEYDQLAQEYNAAASRFPANLISSLTGLDPLDSFR